MKPDSSQLGISLKDYYQVLYQNHGRATRSQTAVVTHKGPVVSKPEEKKQPSAPPKKRSYRRKNSTQAKNATSSEHEQSPPEKKKEYEMEAENEKEKEMEKNEEKEEKKEEVKEEVKKESQAEPMKETTPIPPANVTVTKSSDKKKEEKKKEDKQSPPPAKHTKNRGSLKPKKEQVTQKEKTTTGLSLAEKKLLRKEASKVKQQQVCHPLQESYTPEMDNVVYKEFPCSLCIYKGDTPAEPQLIKILEPIADKKDLRFKVAVMNYQNCQKIIKEQEISLRDSIVYLLISPAWMYTKEDSICQYTPVCLCVDIGKTTAEEIKSMQESVTNKSSKEPESEPKYRVIDPITGTVYFCHPESLFSYLPGKYEEYDAIIEKKKLTGLFSAVKEYAKMVKAKYECKEITESNAEKYLLCEVSYDGRLGTLLKYNERSKGLCIRFYSNPQPIQEGSEDTQKESQIAWVYLSSPPAEENKISIIEHSFKGRVTLEEIEEIDNSLFGTKDMPLPHYKHYNYIDYEQPVNYSQINPFALKCKICNYLLDNLPYIACSHCKKCFHKQCLTETQLKVPERTPYWRCTNCKRCSSCLSSKDTSNFLTCAVCNITTHHYCLEPHYRLQMPSDFKKLSIWKCDKCVRCDGCKSRVPGPKSAKWSQDYSLCAKCKKKKASNQYCPICEEIWNEQEEAPMIECICGMWVHKNCDKLLTDSRFESYDSSSKEYTCPNCRQKKRTQYILQIIDVLINGDRHHMFFNPVDTTIYANYTSVISKPMCFKVMKEKAIQGKYLFEPEEMKADFELICNNAKTFNMPKTRIYKEAEGLMLFGQNILKTKWETLFKNKELSLEESKHSKMMKDSKRIKQSPIISPAMLIGLQEKSKEEVKKSTNVPPRVGSTSPKRGMAHPTGSKEKRAESGNNPDVTSEEDSSLHNINPLMKGDKEEGAYGKTLRKRKTINYNEELLLPPAESMETEEEKLIPPPPVPPPRRSTPIPSTAISSSSANTKRVIKKKDNTSKSKVKKTKQGSSDEKQETKSINSQAIVQVSAPTQAQTAKLSSESIIKGVFEDQAQSEERALKCLYSNPIVCSFMDPNLCFAEMCALCGSFGNPEDFITCIICGETFHPYCTNLPASCLNSDFNKIKQYWKCLNCKYCEICFKAIDEDKLLYCDSCDKAYHTYCLRPALKKVPDCSWKCKDCFSCAKCKSKSFFDATNENEANNEHFDFSHTNNFKYCHKCGTSEYEKTLCTICNKREKDGSLQMCSICGKWSHLRCSRIKPKEFEEMKKMKLDFKCITCLVKERSSHEIHNEVCEAYTNIHNIIYRHCMLSSTLNSILHKYLEPLDEATSSSLLSAFVEENSKYFKEDADVNAFLRIQEGHVSLESGGSSESSGSDKSDDDAEEMDDIEEVKEIDDSTNNDTEDIEVGYDTVFDNKDNVIKLKQILSGKCEKMPEHIKREYIKEICLSDFAMDFMRLEAIVDFYENMEFKIHASRLQLLNEVASKGLEEPWQNKNYQQNLLVNPTFNNMPSLWSPDPRIQNLLDLAQPRITLNNLEKFYENDRGILLKIGSHMVNYGDSVMNSDHFSMHLLKTRIATGLLCESIMKFLKLRNNHPAKLLKQRFSKGEKKLTLRLSSFKNIQQRKKLLSVTEGINKYAPKSINDTFIPERWTFFDSMYVHANRTLRKKQPFKTVDHYMQFVGKNINNRWDQRSKYLSIEVRVVLQIEHLFTTWIPDYLQRKVQDWKSGLHDKAACEKMLASKSNKESSGKEGGNADTIVNVPMPMDLREGKEGNNASGEQPNRKMTSVDNICENASQEASELDTLVVNPSQNLICCMCKQNGERKISGRLIPFIGALYVHTNCAIWSSEVIETLDGALINFFNAFKKSRSTKCCKCGKTGASLTCVGKKCHSNFHFICAVSTQMAFLSDRQTYCRSCAMSRNYYLGLPVENLQKRRVYILKNIINCNGVEDITLKPEIIERWRPFLLDCFNRIGNLTVIRLNSNLEKLISANTSIASGTPSAGAASIKYSSFSSDVEPASEGYCGLRIFWNTCNRRDPQQGPPFFASKAYYLCISNGSSVEIRAFDKSSTSILKQFVPSYAQVAGLTEIEPTPPKEIQVRESQSFFADWLSHLQAHMKNFSLINLTIGHSEFTGITKFPIQAWHTVNRRNIEVVVSNTHEILRSIGGGSRKEMAVLCPKPQSDYNRFVGDLREDTFERIIKMNEEMGSKTVRSIKYKRINSPAFIGKIGVREVGSVVEEAKAGVPGGKIPKRIKTKELGYESKNVKTNVKDIDLPIAMKYRNYRKMPKKVEVAPSRIHKNGLFATEDFYMGEIVAEYVGELIRNKVADKREKIYQAKGIADCYMFRINKDLIVDATLYGSKARYLNHSCAPNCSAKISEAHLPKHILIYANRHIKAGEELTYDYQFETETVKIQCKCGAPNCQGRLN